MLRRSLTAKELVAGAALAAAAALAWKATQAAAEPEPAPAAPPPPPPDPLEPRRRRFRAGRLTALVAVGALVAAGMAFSAGPNERLEAARPAAPVFRPSAASRVVLLPVASRHLYDASSAPIPRKAAPRATPDERTTALARYVGALGGDTLLAGLEAERSALAQRVLADPRVRVYPGGRNDLASGRVDPRIDALLEYLVDTYGEVTVSCLISGHSYFVHQTKKDKKLKRPRVVSAHVSGHAVDISAVAGIPIAGNQQPGGITEQTIRRILALPDWLRPKQVISLLELGGPSFALADHADHIHVGY
jgi:hypothetical protein